MVDEEKELLKKVIEKLSVIDEALKESCVVISELLRYFRFQEENG